MIDHILKNTVPNRKMINRYSNQAVSTKNYMSLLKSIIQVLQFRRIGVLISMHTLVDGDTGGLWYNDEISEKAYLSAIDTLTTNLCSPDYWNVMGIDVKNEPFDATWGTDDETDFRLGAARITERMLKGCPKWMGFVEGLNYKSHDIDIDGEAFTYNDWYGGGLQDAHKYPIKLSTPAKIVWAPHYYTSAVFVQPYFYDGGTVDPDTQELHDFVELSDKVLETRVDATMTDMFGYLVDESPQYAMLLGEFGGLYAGDKHPQKTIQRTVDCTISTMLARGYAGGFAWSLNPESKYQYCSADQGGRTATFEEGLLELDWLTTNAEYLHALKAMDTLPDLRQFPCFSSR
jgi:endoglucanase